MLKSNDQCGAQEKLARPFRIFIFPFMLFLIFLFVIIYWFSHYRNYARIQEALAFIRAGDTISLLEVVSRDPHFYARPDRILLYSASIKGEVRSLRLLLLIGSDPNSPIGNEALWGAIRGDCADCVRLLLESGATCNVKDSMGVLPLSYARNGKQDKIVRVLEEACK